IYNPFQNTLTFTQTMAGPVAGALDANGGNLGSYSWGINHGYSNLNFNELSTPTATFNVLFDSVLTLNPNATATYRGSQAPAGSVIRSGNTLTAVLPVSGPPGTFSLAPPPLPANAQGPLLPVEQWSYNLWPRSSFRA